MTDIKTLLSRVKTKIEEAEKIAFLKGEHFNVFSILNLESAENKTHSAFLCELLNPSGSHGFGDTFLKLFLKELKKLNPDHVIMDNFNVKDSTVTAELSIGKINYQDKTGGRLDIVMTDIAGNNIIIENKIYASDQEIQIERYCNYQTDNSIVYYLTLDGKEPEEKSYDSKKVNTDFYLLSYKEDIIRWLSLCQKEAVDSPIVRESIKQYSILLKKLTNQLTSDTMSQEIKDIIKQNLKGAKGIAENYEATLNEIKENLRQKVREELHHLQLTLNHDWQNTISKKFANIFIDTDMPNVKFLIESFNGRGWFKGLCVGIWINRDQLSENQTQKYEAVFNGYQMLNEEYWFGREYLNLDLADINDLEKLANNSLLSEQAKLIANQVSKYVNAKNTLIKELKEVTDLN